MAAASTTMPVFADVVADYQFMGDLSSSVGANRLVDLTGSYAIPVTWV